MNVRTLSDRELVAAVESIDGNLCHELECLLDVQDTLRTMCDCDDTDRDFMPYAKLHALFRDAKETSVNETSINVLYPHVCRWWKALVYAAKNSDVHTRLNSTVRQKRTDIEQQLQKLVEQIQPS